MVESDSARNLAAEEPREEITATKTVKNQAVKYKTQEFNGLDKSVGELSIIGVLKVVEGVVADEGQAGPRSWALTGHRR